MNTTSLQRTYRYLRLAIAGTVMVIAVAVGVASLTLGEILPSISAYYFSPAQVPFTGALVAASLGMFALSGRGLERTLIDAAAGLAPLIALIPTPVAPAADVEIDVGVITYVVVGAGVWMLALILHRTDPRSIRASLIIGLATLASVLGTWLFAREVLTEWGHLVAAGGFFLLIAAVAFRSIFPFEGERDPRVGVRRAYLVIGIAMVVDVVALVAAIIGSAQGFPYVFIGEFAALALFVAFWILQSTRKWDLPDPSLAYEPGTQT